MDYDMKRPGRAAEHADDGYTGGRLWCGQFSHADAARNRPTSGYRDTEREMIARRHEAERPAWDAFNRAEKRYAADVDAEQGEGCNATYGVSLLEQFRRGQALINEAFAAMLEQPRAFFGRSTEQAERDAACDEDGRADWRTGNLSGFGAEDLYDHADKHAAERAQAGASPMVQLRLSDAVALARKLERAGVHFAPDLGHVRMAIRSVIERHRYTGSITSPSRAWDGY